MNHGRLAPSPAFNGSIKSFQTVLMVITLALQAEKQRNVIQVQAHHDGHIACEKCNYRVLYSYICIACKYKYTLNVKYEYYIIYMYIYVS